MATTPRPITDEAELRAILGTRSAVVASKISDRLNDLTRQFIERSPFVCVATKLPDGGIDVSPRGDPASFVRILDERTLLIPERPGNRLADTLTNLLGDPAIEGAPPKLGIVVSIEEAYTQCSKALIRSDLWNADHHIDRSELPSSGE